MKLDTLPEDILLDIAKFLEVADVVSLRKVGSHVSYIVPRVSQCSRSATDLQTSRALQSLTHARSLWFDVLCSKIARRNIPVPGCSIKTLSTLSAGSLERLVARALLLHRNWTSPRPRATSVTLFKLNMDSVASPESLEVSTDLLLSLRCLALYFLPGRGNKYLITLARRDQLSPLGPHSQRSYEIHCWDIATPEKQLASGGDKGTTAYSRCIAKYTCAGLLAACLNADPTHPACLALTQHIEP